MTALLDVSEFEPWITEPGVYEISADEYHRDPVVGGSLSSTGARKLIPPSCPAKYKWDRDHAADSEPINRTFNFGHAAHKLVLGAGPELVKIEAENYRTKDAKAAQAAALAAGKVPLLLPEWDQVHAMAAAIKAHPVSAFLNPATARCEICLVWQDGHTGVMCRALVDCLQPFALVDYKSANCGDTEELGRACDKFGYAQQNDFYATGARALGLADENTPFVFIAQEKDAPYLITPFQLDSTALRIGKERNIRALNTYRHCTETDYWPGHVYDPNEIPWVSLPPWVEKREGDTQ